jgi:hypothetical protein
VLAAEFACGELAGDAAEEDHLQEEALCLHVIFAMRFEGCPADHGCDLNVRLAANVWGNSSRGAAAHNSTGCACVLCCL